MFTRIASMLKWYVSHARNRYAAVQLEKEMLKRFSQVTFKSGAVASPDCSFEDGVVLHANARLSATKVGRRTYIGPDALISGTTIGRYCSIGHELLAGLGRHPTSGFISTYPAFFSKNNTGCLCSFVDENLYEENKEITIGNDVWIGARSIIVDGVNIANGAIVGAGAVVANDVPNYAIVGGVPAKVIRYRFSEEIIEQLLKLAWWDWDESKLRESQRHCAGMNVQKFIDWALMR